MLSDDYLQRLHKEMFGDVWKWAGKFREVEDIQAGEHHSDQDPHAIAVIERDEGVGRRTDLRLIAVN
jgi:fido (protein-threonine AMPylation protein)